MNWPSKNKPTIPTSSTPSSSSSSNQRGLMLPRPTLTPPPQPHSHSHNLDSSSESDNDAEDDDFDYYQIDSDVVSTFKLLTRASPTSVLSMTSAYLQCPPPPPPKTRTRTKTELPLLPFIPLSHLLQKCLQPPTTNTLKTIQSQLSTAYLQKKLVKFTIPSVPNEHVKVFKYGVKEGKKGNVGGGECVVLVSHACLKMYLQEIDVMYGGNENEGALFGRLVVDGFGGRKALSFKELAFCVNNDNEGGNGDVRIEPKKLISTWIERGLLTRVADVSKMVLTSYPNTLPTSRTSTLDSDDEDGDADSPNENYNITLPGFTSSAFKISLGRSEIIRRISRTHYKEISIRDLLKGGRGTEKTDSSGIYGGGADGVEERRAFLEVTGGETVKRKRPSDSLGGFKRRKRKSDVDDGDGDGDGGDTSNEAEDKNKDKDKGIRSNTRLFSPLFHINEVCYNWGGVVRVDTSVSHGSSSSSSGDNGNGNDNGYSGSGSVGGWGGAIVLLRCA